MFELCVPLYVQAKTDKHKAKANDPARLRADYIAKAEQYNTAAEVKRTPGSLWSPDNALGDLGSDYIAHRLNDTVTIQVSVQTAAAQSGLVDGSRALTGNSSITGVLGQAPSIANPLLAAQSASTIKGQGQTASNTSFVTNLTGQIIAVLPSGNLVVEAQREVFMNNQHEHITVRGVVRPGDIGPTNAVSSTSLSGLEIEMKGKGIIADNTRPPNFLSRAVLWLFGF
ncbi:flagellar basal body L-ring protein FlgH [Granulicella sp. 5B5]|uniref:flagellar basal body L-ring protein FlgH n=1 Tax=Granulicella sp. 5B5 TaxID=1617967 RepID=UPI00210826B9|nr:flagellar basal body L-ring protein FlgH [Granulicella sp. 5B5]